MSPVRSSYEVRKKRKSGVNPRVVADGMRRDATEHLSAVSLCVQRLKRDRSRQTSIRGYLRLRSQSLPRLVLMQSGFRLRLAPLRSSKVDVRARNRASAELRKEQRLIRLVTDEIAAWELLR
jgi:hypothetical protein